MPFWKPPYLSIDEGGWTHIDYALSQHFQLLEISGFPCKILFRKTEGEAVGEESSQVEITTWDETAPIPKKTIWQFGDDEELFPDTRSIRVFVDGEELDNTYDSTTIESDTEFYVVSQVNILSIDDNVAIYFNDGFDVSGKVISYFYDSISKNINVVENLQPSGYASTFRTEFVGGFTQYTNQSSTFRGQAAANTLLVSFPVNPFDTVFTGQGRSEQQKSLCWTVGDRLNYPLLREFDVIYRTDIEKWYELRDYRPNYLQFGSQTILLTQSFDVAELSPDDILLDFELK